MNKFQKLVNKRAKNWYLSEENMKSNNPFTFRECRREWRMAYNYIKHYNIDLAEKRIFKKKITI